MELNTSSPVNDILIFDAHCDTANVLLDDSFYFINQNKSHLSFDKIKTGGLKAQIFALWVNPCYGSNGSLKKALILYNALDKKIFSPGFGVKVTSTSEMDSAISDRKLACWIFLEGGHIIEDSIEILEFFYLLGIRGITITHTKNTGWADSSGDKPKWNGLNDLGCKIISKMNELGMVIDVSHSSDKTVEDILEISSSPVMASHSCARALCDIPRNLSDNLIKKIADNKGFIGINFHPAFLSSKIYAQLMKNLEKNKIWYDKQIIRYKNNPDTLNKIEMDLFNRMVKGNSTIDLNILIDHIAHVSNVGGIDCVGLGSDFDGIKTTPVDLTDVSCYPALIDGLYRRGFNKSEIKKIMGLNLLRFLKRFD